MIDLYYGPTPNGQKISIALEELGLPYTVHLIESLTGDQFKPEFLAINPNNKQPAIVDRDGPNGRTVTVWESGAILLYLAEKTGKLLPADAIDRIEALKWLFFQVAGVGPMSGQYAFFNTYAREKVPMAIERYRNELSRQARVMQGHMRDREYFAGEYSIADIAILPWWVLLSQWLANSTPDRYPVLDAWADRLQLRNAVRTGLALRSEAIRPDVIMNNQTPSRPLDDKAYGALYGGQQYERRQP